jgi:predicted ATPase with chaperone activity
MRNASQVPYSIELTFTSNVPRVDYEKLNDNRVSESSESIRARVQATRNIQQTRFANSRCTDIVSNADMRIGEIRKFCQLQLSARAYHHILYFVAIIWNSSQEAV